MQKSIETETVTNNIIQEIIRQCTSRGVHVTDTTVAYVIKLITLNPDHGFIFDRPVEKDDVRRLVDVCVAKLCEKNSPSLNSLYMQVYFDNNYAPRDTIIAENHMAIKLRTGPLLKQIIGFNAKTRPEFDKLYRKLVLITISCSGLGNPTFSSVIKEATAALQSVFPPIELEHFMQMSRKEKDEQISELTEITTGIRLFNRDCNKGGEGIDDLPNLLTEATAATQSSLEEQLQRLMAHINSMTTAVENALKPDNNEDTASYQEGASACRIESLSEQGEKQEQKEERKEEEEEDDVDEDDDQEEEEDKEEVGEDKEEKGDDKEKENKVCKEKWTEITKCHIDMIKGCLVTARQQEVYLRKLLDDVEVSNTIVTELVEKLQDRLLHIHETVRFRTAIPTGQVYPQFINLAEIWRGLQDEMVVLSNVNDIANHLCAFVEIMDLLPKRILKSMIKHSEILTDEQRLEATMGLEITDAGICDFIHPMQVTDFDKLPLQYQGFCVWSLVEGEGALIPGNPNMGVCRWKGNYYAFSSPDAASAFCADPDRYILEVLDLVRKKVELINLLQLEEEVAAMKFTGELPVKKPEPIIKCDADVQTETHPVPMFVDVNYKWNVWDLKREAIQLTNIVNSKTTSSQTYVSHYRVEKCMQIAPDKHKGTQTKRDNSSNIAPSKDFIFGLRGRKNKVPFVVSFPNFDLEIESKPTCDGKSYI